MKELVFTRRFERDFRRLKKRLPCFREHSLRGDLAGFFECHIDADCLLIYRVTRSRVVFHRIGTHHELFRSRRGRG